MGLADGSHRLVISPRASASKITLGAGTWRRMGLKVVPLTLKQLNAHVEKHHRHHKPIRGHRFSIGAELDGVLVGACSVGRPVARNIPQWEVAEVTRLVTDGTKNSCSILYAAAARACAAMGFKRIQTYILEDESGTSLRASGWKLDGVTQGNRHWQREDCGGPRRTDQPSCAKQRWIKELN